MHFYRYSTNRAAKKLEQEQVEMQKRSGSAQGEPATAAFICAPCGLPVNVVIVAAAGDGGMHDLYKGHPCGVVGCVQKW